MNSRHSLLESRGLVIVATFTVGVAAAGFFTGTSHSYRSASAAHFAPNATGASIGRARSYAELRDERRGENARMYESAFKDLEHGLPQLTDAVSQSPADRERALTVRSSRRAYNGAPPTIPHAIDQRGMPSCTACHERGAKVGTLIAPVMSHALYTNCVQCHVVGVSPKPLSEADWAGNSFQNTGFAQLGERAWQGAPPTIPHTTHMRENCSSCHGTTGALGLRTPHPDRQSCTQCHAPSAALDQRPSPPNASSTP